MGARSSRRESLTAGEARRIALAAQGFANSRPCDPANPADWRRLRGLLERIGLLQMDSISVLARAHYLPAFSRLGAYDTAALDRRAWKGGRQRALFEYWGHEASLLPLASHPLLRWRMQQARRGQGLYKSLAAFGRERADYIAEVLALVRDRGPLAGRELEAEGGGAGWWNWHEGKVALEYLFWTGQVTTATRRGFERIYDLTERVIPAKILDLPTPSEAEAQKALLMLAARAHGVGTEGDLRDYYRLPAKEAKPCLAELVEEGALLPVTVEGWRQPAYLHPEAVIARGLKPTALLSPFDPLVWERDRCHRLFGFHYRLEVYTPEPKRQYGYYVLPFLEDGHLTARLDLKAERAASRIHVLAAHAEPGGHHARTAEALSGELRHLADWLGLERIAVAGKGDLAKPLAAALPA